MYTKKLSVDENNTVILSRFKRLVNTAISVV